MTRIKWKIKNEKLSCAAYVMNTNHTNWTNKMIRMIRIIRGLITYKIIWAITWALYVRLLLFVYFGVWCYFELEWRLCLIRYSSLGIPPSLRTIFRTRIARITRKRRGCEPAFDVTQITLMTQIFFSNTNRTNWTNQICLKFLSFSIFFEILSRLANRAPATYYVNR